ncbi:MAG TPA: hypothetical protein VF177_16820 [Anaerolineae bacterium]
MNEQIRLLQAEIRDDLEAIKNAYIALNNVSRRELDAETSIIVGYYLHVIYGLFENLFTRIATLFGNRLNDQAQWHTQLLRRMTLEVQEVRPRVISDEAYQHLDELRRFRHLFRNAYLLRFDLDRLALVLRDAQQLEQLYERDLETFLTLLDHLVDE